MEIIINGKIKINTKLTLMEIGKKIANNDLDVNEGNNLIYWRNVFSIEIK